MDLKTYALLFAEEGKGYNRVVRNLSRAVSRAQKRNKNSDLALTNFREVNRLRIECRKEARALGLARAFIRGKDYLMVEHFCYQLPDIDLITEWVCSGEGSNNYGTIKEEVEKWIGC